MSNASNRYDGGYLVVGLGMSAALLTMGVREVSRISDQPLIGLLQRVLMLFILPGLIASMGLAGNSHAFSLFVAAVVNGLFYALWGLLVRAVFRKIKNRNK